MVDFNYISKQNIIHTKIFLNLNRLKYYNISNACYTITFHELSIKEYFLF